MNIPFDLEHVILFKYPDDLDNTKLSNNVGIGIIQCIEIRSEGNIYNIGFDIKEDQIIKSIGFKDDISVEIKKVTNAKYKWAEGKILPLIDISSKNNTFQITQGTILVCAKEDINRARRSMFPVSIFKLINDLTGNEFYSKGYKNLELIKK